MGNVYVIFEIWAHKKALRGLGTNEVPVKLHKNI